MAACCGLTFSTKEECLKEFARTYGQSPPRDPVPKWFDMLLEEDPGATRALESNFNWWAKSPPTDKLWYKEFERWFEELAEKPDYRDKEGKIGIMVRLEGYPWEDNWDAEGNSCSLRDLSRRFGASDG